MLGATALLYQRRVVVEVEAEVALAAMQLPRLAVLAELAPRRRFCPPQMHQRSLSVKSPAVWCITGAAGEDTGQRLTVRLAWAAEAVRPSQTAPPTPAAVVAGKVEMVDQVWLS